MGPSTSRALIVDGVQARIGLTAAAPTKLARRHVLWPALAIDLIFVPQTFAAQTGSVRVVGTGALVAGGPRTSVVRTTAPTKAACRIVLWPALAPDLDFVPQTLVNWAQTRSIGEVGQGRAPVAGGVRTCLRLAVAAPTQPTSRIVVRTALAIDLVFVPPAHVVCCGKRWRSIFE